ncbi:DUF6879 family protein [Streptomyces sp. ME19-01-6]|uniref:DUF6879 family protein n=1 Tax=Streptomyces sp. ME19-01-6 TaxID=3028686 RepID=UPI0029A86BC5|nr:DUF6879 family protein [Streptomyces sp. ME19-01-6]MDX3226112.1 hypothetical protein [Streptomyces sp. ME19-01-6]
MLDVRAPALPVERGQRLGREEYLRDFRARDAAIRNGESWKLERLQHFEEVGVPSRDALRRGDWDMALRLLEEGRENLRGIQADEEARGSVFHRVRVVEEPLTPYVQWELHTLRISAEYGERVRILPDGMIASAETDGLLPELTIQDGKVLFRVLYSDTGVPDGAIRFTDPDIVEPWTEYVREAYATAEDIASYFDRAVAPLSPPPAA